MKSALAHKGGIELVVLSSGIVVDIQSLLWTDGGSAARLSGFFFEERNPIASYLRLALNDLMEKLDLKLYQNCKARFLRWEEQGVYSGFVGQMAMRDEVCTQSCGWDKQCRESEMRIR